MVITPIRNGTFKLMYNGLTMMVDPRLINAKHLPDTLENLVRDVEIGFFTHLHPNHIDIDADGKVCTYFDRRKIKALYTIDEDDALEVYNTGYRDIWVLGFDTWVRYREIRVRKTLGLHGSLKKRCETTGFLLRTVVREIQYDDDGEFDENDLVLAEIARNEPYIYFAGDTIWFDGVRDVLEKYQPEVVILNVCEQAHPEYGHLFMRTEDIENVRQLVPRARIITMPINLDEYLSDGE